ncbi:hypothetical protein V5G24_20060 [Xanthobacter sp. VTT E-85241]|uniref:hypothetical protein n=1 Tax=Roseixanthobacter finlandensis TaxID=3119922 RepID=UPI003728EEEA
MNENAEREAFEKWAVESFPIEKSSDGYYHNHYAQYLWCGWKERAALSSTHISVEVNNASKFYRAAKKLCDNINEFGQVSDCEIYDNIESALARVEGHCAISTRDCEINVRLLEWEWRSDTNPRFWRAQTTFDWGYRIYEGVGDFSTTLGNERFSTSEAAMGACQADYEQRIRSALIEPAPTPAGVNQDDPDEAYELGKRDGREDAAQEIDRLTGGDGEYSFSTFQGEGCSTPEAMIQRIVDRFSALEEFEKLYLAHVMSPAPAGVDAVTSTKAAFEAFCRHPDPVVDAYHRGTKRKAFEAGARAALAHLGVPDLSKQEG